MSDIEKIAAELTDLHDYLRHQEPANYTLPPREDLVAASIERTKIKIAECFDGARKVRAHLENSNAE